MYFMFVRLRSNFFFFLISPEAPFWAICLLKTFIHFALLCNLQSYFQLKNTSSFCGKTSPPVIIFALSITQYWGLDCQYWYVLWTIALERHLEICIQLYMLRTGCQIIVTFFFSERDTIRDQLICCSKTDDSSKLH